MGVKFSQLPVASSVASDDYIAVLDTSENILKRTQISHASTATQYGVGGTSNYGHNKLLDGLSRTTYQEGEALSSHQGNVLANDMGTFEPGARAAYAHAVGEYFMWVGQFVKVTAAIAAGDTIAIGTNVASTNVAAVLSELNSKSVPIDIKSQCTIHIEDFLSRTRIYCIGNIVVAHFYFATAGGSTHIRAFTVPNAYRPKYVVSVPLTGEHHDTGKLLTTGRMYSLASADFYFNTKEAMDPFIGSVTGTIIWVI